MDKLKKPMYVSVSEEELIKKFREEQKEKWQPRSANTYTDAEKVEVFNKLHAIALSNYNHVVESGRELKDFDHWCMEALMELLSTTEQKVWVAYNKLNNS